MSERPRRRRLGLSVRALMVLVGVVAVVIGWRVDRARNQRLAVAAIKAKKGTIAYDFQFDPYNIEFVGLGRSEPDAPEWLRRAFGDEYFQEVTWVKLNAPDSNDLIPALGQLDHLIYLVMNMSKLDASSLARLAKLPALEELILWAEQDGMTDEGLTSLTGARKLRVLKLQPASSVTGAGMAHLAGLTELQELWISDAPKLTASGLGRLGPKLAELERLLLHETGLTDEGMACLAVCRRLKRLDLDGARIGDAGFAHFRHMESLMELSADSTGVTDEGLAALRGLQDLRRLSLARTRIVGPGLVHLVGLDRLEELDLSETRITDEALVVIRKMKALREVGLAGTQVTAEAVAALEAERPSLRIGYLRPNVTPPPPPSPPEPPAAN